MIKNIFLVFVIFSSLQIRSQHIKVMTWNIRFDNKGDSLDQWEYRKEDLARVVKAQKPDFLGIQEGLHHQVEYLGNALKSYSWIGVGRDDGVKGGEFTALYYNKSKWRPVKASQFWLSDTPQMVSRGWDAACHRVTTYGIFTNKQGDTIAVYNTHFDHMGEIARKNSVDQVNELLNDSKYPKILMGDFNFNPSSNLYSAITSKWSDSRTTAKKTDIFPEGTFNGFKVHEIPENRIDYIFLDKNWKVKKYSSRSKLTKKGRHVSDHNLVMANLEIIKKKD